MTRIILCGCCGKMGHFITQLVSERTDCEIVAGVDLNVNAQTASYPAYTSIAYSIFLIRPSSLFIAYSFSFRDALRSGL